MRNQIVRRFLAVVGLWLVLASLAAANDQLKTEISRVIDSGEFKTAHWGILVVDLASSQTIFELNPDRLFAPASVTKLFSTAAALDVLGADYLFETPVYRKGDVDAAGKLTGDLIQTGQWIGAGQYPGNAAVGVSVVGIRKGNPTIRARPATQ